MKTESIEGLQKHSHYSRCNKCTSGCLELEIVVKGNHLKLNMELEEDRLWFAWFCLATSCKQDPLYRSRIENSE